MASKTDDEWADSISHAMEIACPDECEIGGVKIEVGSVSMLFFHRPDLFPTAAGLALRAGTAFKYKEGYEKVEVLAMVQVVLEAHGMYDLRCVVLDHYAWGMLLDAGAVVQRHEVIGVRYDDYFFARTAPERCVAHCERYEYGLSVYHDVGTDDQILDAVRYIDSVQRLESEREY